MAIKNMDELVKFLAGWLGTVAGGLKKEGLAVIVDDSLASRVAFAIAAKSDKPLTVFNQSFAAREFVEKTLAGREAASSVLDGDEFELSDNELLVGSQHKDMLIINRPADRTGGELADVLPLGGMHFSEVRDLARHFGIAVLDSNPYEETERVLRMAQTFFGEARGDTIYHMGTVFEQVGLESEEFRKKLKAMGEEEVRTRFRHNPNIPVADVRKMGFVS
jgi:hypothetical protein